MPIKREVWPKIGRDDGDFDGGEEEFGKEWGQKRQLKENGEREDKQREL